MNQLNAPVAVKRVLAGMVACAFAPLVLLSCLRDRLTGRPCRITEWGDA